MSVTEELQAAARAVAEGPGASTVRIGRDGGRGVGFVFEAGMVVTNAHNLRGPTATVTFPGGRTEQGQVQGVDGDGDLAVIAVDTGPAPAVTWGDGEVPLGTPVWAVALTPSATPRVTRGEVSAVGRPFRGPRGRIIAGTLEHTAPLARGSSGSPLVDGAGRVVGLNTHRLGDGFYLALPADGELRRRIEGLREGRTPSRRRLGVALVPPTAARRLRAAVGLSERDGLLIQEVESGGPASQAGLRRGDLLVSAGGRALSHPEDLYDVLEGIAGEQRATLEVVALRGAEELTVQVPFSPAAG